MATIPDRAPISRCDGDGGIPGARYRVVCVCGAVHDIALLIQVAAHSLVVRFRKPSWVAR